jgi:DNA-directed RNA polymerase subunit RPC12/RpoP
MQQPPGTQAAREALAGTCSNCGGYLVWDPSGQGLRCIHCGTRTAIPPAPGRIERLPYERWAGAEASVLTEEVVTHTCTACGATTSLSPGVTSGRCPFCDRPFVGEARSARFFKPQALVPLMITEQRAVELYRAWLGRLWFAPSALRRTASAGAFTSIYVPNWSFDCGTMTRYAGQRGVDRQEAYTDEETDSDGNTRTVTRYRTVTDWYPASGTVSRDFSDLLIPASDTLSSKEGADLEPWDMGGLHAYRPEYVLGSLAESYSVDLPTGWGRATERMKPSIEGEVRSDIGGDHQRISRMDTAYDAIRFLHLLLPIWVAAYWFKNESYRVLVNGQTGEVHGRRPYSVVKIVLLVLVVVAVLCAIGVAVYLYDARYR